MKNLYLDPLTNDLAVENFQLKLTSNYSEWLAQRLENKLKFFLGEWFANIELGVPYYQSILKKQADINSVTSIFLNVIKKDKGVQKVISFNAEYDNSLRKYALTFSVLSNENEVVNGGTTI